MPAKNRLLSESCEKIRLLAECYFMSAILQTWVRASVRISCASIPAVCAFPRLRLDIPRKSCRWGNMFHSKVRQWFCH